MTKFDYKPIDGRAIEIEARQMRAAYVSQIFRRIFARKTSLAGTVAA